MRCLGFYATTTTFYYLQQHAIIIMYDRHNPSIFSVPPSPHTALLSFLSPPTDVENCDGDRKSHGLPGKKEGGGKSGK